MFGLFESKPKVSKETIIIEKDTGQLKKSPDICDSDYCSYINTHIIFKLMSTDTTLTSISGKKFGCELATCLNCGKKTENSTGTKTNEELIAESIKLGKFLNKRTGGYKLGKLLGYKTVLINDRIIEDKRSPLKKLFASPFEGIFGEGYNCRYYVFEWKEEQEKNDEYWKRAFRGIS